MPELQARNPLDIEKQRRFWNDWNSQYRLDGMSMPQVNWRQAQIVVDWMAELERTDLDVLEVGCGSGWLCRRLAVFGRITGTDLANEVLPGSDPAERNVTFIAGDFLALDFPSRGFDVVVSLEVLAHVEAQDAFLAKIARLLRPGGYLMLATQNRFALERWSQVAARGNGQIRKWVDARTLRRLVGAHLEIVRLTSICPEGDRGILRWINAPKINRMLSLFAPQSRIDGLKERLFLGHTLMVLARKPALRTPN
jgi:2-polyprenyl-3-methyl-5-hydroxy-6-metoxy-1,4-benzoquinol methylase